MGSSENFEGTRPAEAQRDSEPTNLAAYSVERMENVPSLYAIQQQSLVDKGFLPSFDLEVPNANPSGVLRVCPEDPGIDPWRGREIPDIDPGFDPWRGRELPDIDPGFNPWRGRELPDIDPGFNPWRGRRRDFEPGVNPWKNWQLPDDNDPGFTPSRGRGLPDGDPGFDGWKPQELPRFSPEEWDKLIAKGVPEASKEDIAKAEKAVDKKADVNSGPAPLSEKEQSERKRLDHAILEGNIKEIETILLSHKDDPAALNRVLAAVNDDLREAGIHMSWQTGNMMMGNDTDFHQVGYLKIFRQGGDKALSFSTDQRIGTAVGGPIQWDKDGQPIDLNMGLAEDPNRAMKDIANSAVRALTTKK